MRIADDGDRWLAGWLARWLARWLPGWLQYVEIGEIPANFMKYGGFSRIFMISLDFRGFYSKCFFLCFKT